MQRQVLQPDRDARMRGGVERLPSRQAVIERLQQQTGDITDEEKGDLCDLLALGSQVQPTHTHVHPYSAVGVGRVMARAQAAPPLFQRLQSRSIASPNLGEALEVSLSKMFRRMGEKEAKKAMTIKNFAEFTDFFRKAREVTKDTHDADPDSFWAMLWHTQSVTHLYCKHSWAVALQYHMLVMEQWKEGDLDPSSYVETEVFSRGDHLGALHNTNMLLAIDAVRTATSGGRTTGNPIKMTPDWTWCEHCQLYFPPTSNHRTSSCRKKAAAEKGKG